MGGLTTMPDLVDAAGVRAWLAEYARLIEANVARLTELDAAIGDADHGSNMRRGMAAVQRALDEVPSDASPDTVLKTAAMTLISTVGGASGPLYGTLFLRMSTAAGPEPSLHGPAFAASLRSGVVGLAARGKAEIGDKTMYDALAPACDALEAALAAGDDLWEAIAQAARAADGGRDAVTPLVARKGRASYLGQRSAGHQDPGATSAALLIAAVATALGSSPDAADPEAPDVDTPAPPVSG
jgi:dihydroxyacetone kinase-like protein